MQSLISTRERSFEVGCNWKAFLEVFNEYYHLPFVHPDTIGDVYQDPQIPDLTGGSFTSQFGRTSGTGALLQSEQEFALPKMKGIDKHVINSARYTWVFPNITFAVGDDALWIYEVLPLDPERCVITQTTCFPESTIRIDSFEKLSKQYYHRMDAAIEEDIPALENQQKGLNSPYADQGRFSPLLEANVAAFSKWYAKKMLKFSKIKEFSQI
jgi:phenylpropionate dioxygenase-like ring-hydroxylating dioxygenase large terminal subunit